MNHALKGEPVIAETEDNLTAGVTVSTPAASEWARESMA